MPKNTGALDFSLIFDRLTIGMIVTLCLIVGLLLVSLLLYSSLQGRSLTTGQELLAEVDDLQETTDDLQETIDVLSELSSESDLGKHNIDKLDDRLEQIDENLTIIEENIGEISSIDTSGLVIVDSSPPSTQEIQDVTQSLNHIFLIVSWIIGLFSIITALVLLVAVSTLHNHETISLQQDSHLEKWAACVDSSPTTSTVNAVYALQDVVEAHQELALVHTRGKSVLQVV